MPDKTPKDVPDADRESYGLPDCTNPVPVGDLPEKRETKEGMAMRVFGKPYGELARCDQKMISQVYRGRNKELREELQYQIRMSRKENASAALDRIKKLDELDGMLYDLMMTAAADVAELEDDNLDAVVVESQMRRKTPAGTLTRKLRNTETILRMNKTYTDTLIAKAKLADEKLTVVQHNDNRQQEAVVVTPDEVRGRLARFASGGVDIGKGEVDDGD